MALKPEDPCSGFRHSNVVAFINEKMARHAKGPEFYLDNLTLSWEEVEDKIRTILEDSEMPTEAQEACAWGSLALGVRFARRQGHLQGRRVQWLHDFAKLHKSAAHALASDLKQLGAQQEMERKEAAFQLRLTQAKLAEVQKERDLLRALPEQAVEGPGLATARGTGTEGSEIEEATAATDDATGGGGGRREESDAVGAAPMEAEQELGGSFLQLLGTTEPKNYASGGQREGNQRFMENAMFSLSGTPNPGSVASPEPLPVQLPASFSYSYSSPLSPFPALPSPSPPSGMITVPPPPQMLPHSSAFDVSLWWSDMGTQGLDPQETLNRKDFEIHQQRKPPVFRRPGDWDCPWCKAVNFSRRESCFRCGRGIWLQSP
uniref:RanBP2-type domain-containing protein n=1 Tax=Sciurus vulgaris TaxID=55149 RepID=A0A8D2JPB5_SCIVU